MPLLVKARSVLEFHGKLAEYFVFSTGEEGRSVLLREQDYVDLGYPQKITVTIVPGDELNEEEE